MTEWSDRTAVVIGGGGGVGRGVCLGLAAVGTRVIVADIDPVAAAATSHEVTRHGYSGTVFEVDSNSGDALAHLANFANETHGNVNILVNATGVILERPLEAISLSEWAWLWQNNVLSQISSVNAFLPFLRQSKPAHIVLTGSGAGIGTPPASLNIGGYTVTKHALTGYAKSLKGELVDDEIGVTLLCPTRIAGNLAENSARCYDTALGRPTTPVGGKPPSPRNLVDASTLGPLVVAAINNKQFLVSNENTEQLDDGIDVT